MVWELQTTPRPVGGSEAADWAGPDGNQVNAMRTSADCSESCFKLNRVPNRARLLLKLQPTRGPPAEGMVNLAKAIFDNPLVDAP